MSTSNESPIASGPTALVEYVIETNALAEVAMKTAIAATNNVLKSRIRNFSYEFSAKRSRLIRALTCI
jgi:hypothetical protein